MNDTRPEQSPSRPGLRWYQFGLSALLSLPLIVALLFGGPGALDAALILGAVILAQRYRKLAIRRASLILCAVPAVLTVISTPAILGDARLPTVQSRLEVLWSTGMLSLFVGMACSLFSQLLTGPSRFSRFCVALSLAALCGSVYMYARSEHWYRRSDTVEWEAPGRLCSFRLAFRHGIGRFHGGGAHVVIMWRGREHSPKLNHMRDGGGVFYWIGARLRAGGGGVFYVHSSKFVGDQGTSPFFGAVIPYWLMIGTSGVLFLKYAGLLPRLFPQRGFSRPSLAVMVIITVAFALMNLFPTAAYHGGVMRDYGFPLTHLHVAIEQGVVLDEFMGYSLGWQGDQLMMNVLLITVVVVGAGICCERLCDRFRRRESSPAA